MKLTVKGLNLEIEEALVISAGKNNLNTMTVGEDKIVGKVDVRIDTKLFNSNVSAKHSIDLHNVSPELQQEIFDLFKKIETELNSAQQ